MPLGNITRSASVGLALLVALASCGQSEEAAGQSEDAFALVAGYPVFSESAALASARTDHITAEEFIVTCMAEQGFDYSQMPFVSGLEAAVESDLFDDLLDDRRFAEEYGFGVVTFETLGDELDESTLTEDEIDALEAQANAEQRTPFDGVASDELEAFAVALYGSDDRSGCHGAAPRSRDVVAYFGLLAEIQAAKTSFSVDPRVIDFHRDWAKCMSDNGYVAETPLGVYQGLVDSAAEAWKSDDVASLRNLQTLERELGTATLECGASTRNLLPADLTAIWEEYAPSGP